ncbi:Zinc finger protein 709 [Frankliniella fusca]|uniref:Zinc finger protein 709 n=1 Tax=Frankliniella fusca TaxID=407009 RepID=A0AAE1H4J4_9NEOP|nr:Zinc finger protein 709 [Frankliniella fusca]
MRRYTRPPLEPAAPGDQLARKIEKTFPEPSKYLLGKPNVKPYFCEQCDRSFLCQSSVDKHLWYHLRREVGMWAEPTPPGESYQCSECEAQFRLLDTYVQHMASHLAYLCSCRLWYPNKLALERHALGSHSRRNLHRCLRIERDSKFWQ